MVIANVCGLSITKKYKYPFSKRFKCTQYSADCNEKSFNITLVEYSNGKGSLSCGASFFSPDTKASLGNLIEALQAIHSQL